MGYVKMEMSVGVAALLANAHAPIPEAEIYVFSGDLCQMACAANVARKLGIDVGVAGGLPYVRTKKEYDKVVQYIIDNKMDGYWHYRK